MTILGMLDFIGIKLKKKLYQMSRSIFSVYLAGEEVDSIEFTFVLYHRLLFSFVLFVLSSCFFAVWTFYFKGVFWIMDYFYCVPATIAGAMMFYAVEVYRDLKNKQD